MVDVASKVRIGLRIVERLVHEQAHHLVAGRSRSLRARAGKRLLSVEKLGERLADYFALALPGGVSVFGHPFAQGVRQKDLGAPHHDAYIMP
jgi:hypothetical protein